MNHWEDYGFKSEADYLREVERIQRMHEKQYDGVNQTRQNWINGRIGPFRVVEEKHA